MGKKHATFLGKKTLNSLLLATQNSGTKVVKVTVLSGPKETGQELGNLPQNRRYGSPMAVAIRNEI